MRWPWTPREEEAHESAEEAKCLLEEAQANREIVTDISERAREHKELNGWTEAIVGVMGQAL